jgi:DNA-directed RNA polymerase specialized sigma24 family protein
MEATMRDAGIEARLNRWADAVIIGDGSGYASVCVLHESWSPPTPGQRPILKSSPASDAGQTHRAIGMLSLRLRNAVVARYIYGGTVAEQAARMDCAPETVRDRIERAHAALMGILAEFCNNPEVS